MKGKLELKEITYKDRLVAVEVYYNDIQCGVIEPHSERGGWYRWGEISDYSLTIRECKEYVKKLFFQLDSFVQNLEK